MAEALLREMSRGGMEVFSAGSEPRPEIHPLARAVMSDLFGLSIEGQYPKTLDRFLGRRLDYVISVCDRADACCPVFPGGTQRIQLELRGPRGDRGRRREKAARLRADRPPTSRAASACGCLCQSCPPAWESQVPICPELAS